MTVATMARRITSLAFILDASGTVEKSTSEQNKVNAKLVILLAIVAAVIAAPKNNNRVKRQLGPMCDICKMLVKYVEDYAEEDEPSIEGAIDSGICDAFGEAFDQVCRAGVHLMLPQIVHIIETDPDYTPDSICRDDLMMC